MLPVNSTMTNITNYPVPLVEIQKRNSNKTLNLVKPIDKRAIKNTEYKRNSETQGNGILLEKSGSDNNKQRSSTSTFDTLSSSTILKRRFIYNKFMTFWDTICSSILLLYFLELFNMFRPF